MVHDSQENPNEGVAFDVVFSLLGSAVAEDAVAVAGGVDSSVVVLKKFHIGLRGVVQCCVVLCSVVLCCVV